ncbi:hypothetical protein BCR37DRAFT_344413 [Protomyces lactucae-debilis]|uniref:EF-hand domain-containing protein n=1 Tax=Protomyces lactucae-debilis TaxID=2754530 RepID=A0A1Y2FNM3_PROLT|nr:uncharacterized protein BCR37DRAFT_344413 [Protomyces lactucae-debilis]ORY85600.1 hypothetical protein BCR37DRAFT_344413 [Protomyces lactucae-debilis]
MPDVLPPSEHWEVKHMRDEHHLDSYDDEFFFRTHDLDSTGYWTPQDIAALYGITGGFEQMEPIAGGEGKVAEVTDDVMQQLDTDRNGKIQLDEWLAFKKRGGQLKSYGFAGHHEDFELAYDLHHVEKYHADDPEGSEATWSHPEDIEHFKKHDEIFHGHANEDPLANIPLKFRKKGL